MVCGVSRGFGGKGEGCGGDGMWREGCGGEGRERGVWCQQGGDATLLRITKYSTIRKGLSSVAAIETAD